MADLAGKLRILNLEDSPNDAELIREQLRADGIDCQILQVDSRSGFLDALEKSSFDLVLADFTLPSFDGLSALAIVRERFPGMPFLFVSGTIGEEKAIEALKGGATDYVLKTKLSRLGPAVRRAMQEAGADSGRKQAEKALRESEERYRMLFINNIDAVMLMVPDGRILSANPAACRMFGRTQEEILELGRSALVDLNDPRLKTLLDERERTGRASGELTFLRKDGTRFPGEVSSLLFTDSDGNPRTSMIIRDITEQKRAEQALKDSEQKYRQLVDNSLVGVYRSSEDGKFLFVNDAFARIFECATPEEMLASPVNLRYRSQEDREAFLDLLRKKKKIPYYEIEAATKNGNQRTIVVSAVLEGGVISGTVLDITEQKKLAAQLRHAQKMEAIGTLAGGIAHDFNNILNVIIGYGSMVLETLDSSSPAKARMQEVLAAADRAANLTKRLLAFSRKEVADLRTLLVSSIVTDMERMLARIIGEDVDLATELEDGGALVCADVGQMEHVLMNLATNARDAMPEGGTLRIATGRKDVDDAFIAAHGYGIPGMYASITVSDTGIGMTAEVQKMIFDPFFTTKGVGEGTGLGLSIVYGIIKQHNGLIQVYSERGKGTTFQILLPLAGQGGEAAPPASPPVAARGGSETILIAEDDPGARKVMRIVLESFGYTVVAADNGEDAVGKFREHSDSVQLAILDLVMPKMGGKEASLKIRESKPGVKVLFMSGYAKEIARTHSFITQGDSFINKPMSPKDLLAKVRELLDG